MAKQFYLEAGGEYTADTQDEVVELYRQECLRHIADSGTYWTIEQLYSFDEDGGSERIDYEDVQIEIDQDIDALCSDYRAGQRGLSDTPFGLSSFQWQGD